MSALTVPGIYSNGHYPAIAVWTDGVRVDFVPLGDERMSVYRLHVSGFAATFRSFNVLTVEEAAQEAIREGGRMSDELRAVLEKIAAGMEPAIEVPLMTGKERQMASKKMEQKVEKKAAQKVSDPGVAQRGRKPTVSDTAKVTVLVKENPYTREGRRAKFDLWKKAKTFGQYVEAGGSRADANWDLKMEYIKVA